MSQSAALKQEACRSRQCRGEGGAAAGSAATRGVPQRCRTKGVIAARRSDPAPSASRLRFGPVGASLGPKGLYRAITASLLRGAVYSSLSYTTKEGLFVQDLPNGFTGFANKAKEQNTNPLDALLRAEHKEPKEDNTPTPTLSKEEVQAIAEYDRRWSWVEVDRSAIQYNVLQTKKQLGSSCRLLAVVKADAYGHGAVEVAKAATAAGASYLGVATVDEGIELRNAGLREPILMLAEPPAQAIPLLLYYNIMPAVYTSEFAIAYAEAADAQGLKAPYHLAINSGMNRIGVHYDSAVEFLHQVSFHRALELKGCFTHFATADSLETLDFQIQIKRFVEAMRSIEAAGFDPGIVHCDNSAATYRFPKTHFDMCRLGISMYGYQAAPDTHKLIDLRPAMSVHARITNVMTVPMSEGVSYGMNYRSPGSVKICTVPIGYADGLIRLLSGKIDFAFNDRAVHQVGNICMDQCMFEVDLRSRVSAPTLDPHIGDEVIIAGPHPTVDCSIITMAKRAATIEHEVTIGFSHRMPRYYR